MKGLWSRLRDSFRVSHWASVDEWRWIKMPLANGFVAWTQQRKQISMNIEGWEQWVDCHEYPRIDDKEGRTVRYAQGGSGPFG